MNKGCTTDTKKAGVFRRIKLIQILQCFCAFSAEKVAINLLGLSATASPWRRKRLDCIFSMALSACHGPVITEKRRFIAAQIFGKGKQCWSAMNKRALGTQNVVQEALQADSILQSRGGYFCCDPEEIVFPKDC